ncbi:MAG: hypothetical protein KKB30_07715 [Proteobacteria bacterium]|nr:hypothetical protein [Pseudomonadota bacterium]MBU1714934.1 hypothetical protein [Pseudomonadota bacterium]
MTGIKNTEHRSKSAPSTLISDGRWKWLLATGLFLIAFVLYLLTTTHNGLIGQVFQPTEKVKMRLGGFSPDNRLLTYDFCRGNNCYAGLLDLHSGKVTKLSPPDTDEWWSSGCFSPSGKYLVFVVNRKAENSRWSQLGLFDIATKSLTKLTHSQSLKEFPSFSPDEKRLIYAQANRERKSGQTRFSDWDIYELDIDTGQERRLTNYEFFLIGSPFYLPDGKKFIFSGDAPSRFLGKVGREANEAYKKLYQDNTIFILGNGADELRPAFTNGQLSHSPKVSMDGKRIMYKATSQDLNRLAGQPTLGYTYDLFMLEDGRHRRLTNLKSSLRGMTMSSDGSLIAFFSEPEGNGEIELWLLDVLLNQSKRIETGADSLFSKGHNK